METTIVYRGNIGNNGKENGNYYSIYMTLTHRIQRPLFFKLECSHLKRVQTCPFAAPFALNSAYFGS